MRTQQTVRMELSTLAQQTVSNEFIFSQIPFVLFLFGYDLHSSLS